MQTVIIKKLETWYQTKYNVDQKYYYKEWYSIIIQVPTISKTQTAVINVYIHENRVPAHMETMTELKEIFNAMNMIGDFNSPCSNNWKNS
jgi:hypothetical protein